MNLLTLPLILAQASEPTTDFTSQPMPEINPAMMIVPMIVGLAVFCLVSAFLFWKVFTKAGQPGWASMVPIYNMYILCKVGGKPGWWVVLMFVPLVNFIIFI